MRGETYRWPLPLPHFGTFRQHMSSPLGMFVQGIPGPKLLPTALTPEAPPTFSLVSPMGIFQRELLSTLLARVTLGPMNPLVVLKKYYYSFNLKNYFWRVCFWRVCCVKLVVWLMLQGTYLFQLAQSWKWISIRQVSLTVLCWAIKHTAPCFGTELFALVMFGQVHSKLRSRLKLSPTPLNHTRTASTFYLQVVFRWNNQCGIFHDACY